MYDILIGLPSRNEEKTIRTVTEIIDTGLKTHFPEKKALLLNVDNGNDKTPQIFLETKTNTDKKTLQSSSPVSGKGGNIMTVIDFAVNNNIPSIAMFDTDLTSINPSWVKKMLQPIVDQKSDFTTPLYQRNRYEGNTTNHICVPLLKMLFGTSPRQPIAGDFAFNGQLAQIVHKTEKIEPMYRYGIDIFLSFTALLHRKRITQVFLGKKIHQPSFDGMIPMVQEVTHTLLWLINSAPTIPSHGTKIKTVGPTLGIDIASNIPPVESISSRQQYAIENWNILKGTPLFEEIFGKEMITLIENDNFHIDPNRWVAILNLVGSMFTERKFSEKSLYSASEIIRVLYLFRVISYFEEVRDRDPEQIEEILDYNTTRPNFNDKQNGAD